MSAPVLLPAGMIATPAMLPGCCVRHGAPASFTRRLTFHSRPHPASYLLLLVFGVGLIAVLAISLTRRRIAAPAWSFCARCRAEHTRAVTLAWVIGLGGAVAGCALGAAVSTSNEGLGVLAFLLGLAVAPLTAAVIGTRGSWVGLAGGEARRDGGAVEFKRPAPGFAAAVRGRPASLPAVASFGPVQVPAYATPQAYAPPRPAAGPPATHQQFASPAQPFAQPAQPFAQPQQQFPSDPRFPAPQAFPPDPRFPAPPQ